MDSRLQRSKLIKKVEDFKTYGVPTDLVDEPEGGGGGDEAKNDAEDEDEDEDEEEEEERDSEFAAPRK